MIHNNIVIFKTILGHVEKKMMKILFEIKKRLYLRVFYNKKRQMLRDQVFLKDILAKEKESVRDGEMANYNGLSSALFARLIKDILP